ncbi:MAG: hypothetical protein JWR32_1384 [Mycobacterium sp.]|jgi:AcrR family transcriptional regulator|nr:hypothetical protein [Mycobacterium sp.]
MRSETPRNRYNEDARAIPQWKVMAAAMQELAERGFEAFSVRGVARRSGVSRPSLLLRWPDRDALIIETLENIAEWPRTNPDGPLRDELAALVRRMVEVLDPTFLAIQLRLIADAPRRPALFAAFQHKVMSKAASQLSNLLEWGVDRGELPESTDCKWAADALVGTVFLRTISAPGLRPLSPSAQSRLITAMITTIGGTS